MANPRKTVAPGYVTLSTPGGHIFVARSDEVDLIDLELYDDLLDPSPPEGWVDVESRQPTEREKRQFQKLLNSLSSLPVSERNGKMIEAMKKMTEQAERAKTLNVRYECAFVLAKNCHDTMVCHRNHGMDLWEVVETSGSGQEKAYVHQDNLKDAWLRGRDVEEFLAELL